MEHRQEFRLIEGIETSSYEEAPSSGGSSTIVMVHGGDPRSLSNALDWSTIWNPAALDARLVAYDKPGQGLSYSASMGDGSFGADFLSAHLESLVASLGGPVVLMGHSRGALPIADVALRRPDLVSSLVLVSSNTLAPESDVTPKEFYVRAYAEPPEDPDPAYLRREPEMNSFSDRHIDEEFIAGRRRAALRNGWWRDRNRRQRAYEGVVIPTLRAMRARVLDRIETTGFEMPVLQIWGQDDVSAPVDLAHGLFRRISDRSGTAISVVFNHAGHYVFREHPVRFSLLVKSFVSGATHG